MKSARFIEVVSESLKLFLEREIKAFAEGLKVRFLTGFPNRAELLESGSSGKKGFFSGLGEKKVEVFFAPYSVGRIQSRRTDEVSTTQKMESGRRLVLSRRGEEFYQIRYLFVGPSISSALGQRVASALISIFFDYRELEVETEGEIESIQFEEPHQLNDPLAREALRENGIQKIPLYLLEVKVPIATGKAIAKDELVQERRIRVDQH